MTPSANSGQRAQVGHAGRDASTHAGLWLDKYLSAFRLPDGAKSDDAGTPIRNLLAEAAGTAVPDGYRATLARRRALIEKLNGGVEGGVTRLFTAGASGRLVIGLGTQAIRETNLALLHTWGVPYLPGSALKGVASAAAHALSPDTTWRKAYKKDPQGEEHAVLFGNTKQAGHVVFHDAWWIPEANDKTLPLDLDIMTVHHPAYYRDGETAPADWDEPTPVAFLTARGKYLVALSGPESWAVRAGEWLKLGLEHLGVGAKTQAGYGRMSLSAELTEHEIEAVAAQEKHAARLKTLGDLPAQHKGAGTARQHIQSLREAIVSGAPAADVYVIARKLCERDAKFWRGWAKEAKRTDEERAFIADSGMLSEPPGARKV